MVVPGTFSSFYWAGAALQGLLLKAALPAPKE
jgi:hypothetical protein